MDETFQASRILSRRNRRRVRGVLVMAAGAVVLSLIGLNQFGLPDRVTRRITERLSQADYAVELDRVKLDLPAGLVANDVKVYRKRTIGPAVFEAASVRAGIAPAFWRWRGGGWFSDIEIRDGVLRPLAAPVRTAGGTPRSGGMAAAVPWGPVSLRCRLLRVDAFGVWIEKGSAEVSLDRNALRVGNLAVTVGRDLQRGTVEGSFVVGADGGSAHLSALVDPHVVLPGLRALGVEQARGFEWFSFPAAVPSGDLSLEWESGVAPRVALKGRIQATQFACRGTAIGFGNVNGAYTWTPTNHTLALGPVVLVVGGRTISGTLDFNLRDETVRIEALSVADVPSLARIAGFREGSFLDVFRFGADTRVYVRGLVDYGRWECNDAEIAVESPSVGYDGFVAEDCAFKVRLAGGTNLLQDVRGRLAGGSFTASADFSPETTGSTNTRYHIRAEALHVDMHQLVTGWDASLASRFEGRVYGNIELTGLMGVGRGGTAVGRGYVNVKRGAIFRVPLFGGLTEGLARKVPGLDFVTRQSDVRAPFEVHDGRIWSRDVQIEGDVLSLTAHGSVTLNRMLDFDVQVRPMRDSTILGTAMRAVTYPISKLFEFRLEGTMSAPRWSAANLVRPSAARNTN